MSLETILKSDYIVCLGTMISNESLEAKDSIIEAIAKNSAEFIYMHPINDIDLKLYSTQFIKYEVGSEEGILALMLDYFAKNPSTGLQEYINDLDIGYISAESSAGEEEFEEMCERASTKKIKTLVLGKDLFSHERASNIKSMIKALEEYSDFNIVLLGESVTLSSSELEEPEELDSYNGTVIYSYFDENSEDIILGSESFSRVAKISNKDNVFINYKNEKIQKLFKIDKDLQGTIALCSINKEDNSFLSKGYSFKQVKIEKVHE